MARPKRNSDYIAHGSDQHAAMLGLAADPESELGWKLEDPLAYVRLDPTGRMEKIVLQQKVSELTTPPPKPQSEDPRLPHYAPRMWVPPEDQETGART